MREIKFRVWDIEDKTMLSWDEVQEEWVEFGYTDSIFTGDHYIPMQYTGLKDKNNVEIYEGDIIGLSCGCCQYRVVYDVDKVCFWIEDDGYSQIHNKDINVWEYKLEVVGNIHENKDLL